MTSFIVACLKVFHQDSFDFKVDNRIFTSGRPNLDRSYMVPSLGTSTDEFTSMLKDYLVQTLGFEEHMSLVDDLLQFADANRDGQVRDHFALMKMLSNTKHYRPNDVLIVDNWYIVATEMFGCVSW